MEREEFYWEEEDIRPDLNEIEEFEE